YGLQAVGFMAQNHDDLLDTGFQKRTKLMLDEGGVPPAKKGLELAHSAGLACSQKYRPNTGH
ncbi:uncharacterized protein METZ01_LOCUS46425, partial [marine metagenome]